MRLMKYESTKPNWTTMPSGVLIVPSESMAPRAARNALLASDATNQLTKYTKELWRTATGQKATDSAWCHRYRLYATTPLAFMLTV